jgi:hypothetical protein
MLYTNYKFNEVSVNNTVKKNCPRCNRLFQKTIKTWQTINPYNKNLDGTIKSHSDILKEITEEQSSKCEEFISNINIVCSKCK